MKKEDLAILEALYNGYYLNPDELERAYFLIYQMQLDLKKRLK